MPAAYYRKKKLNADKPNGLSARNNESAVVREIATLSQTIINQAQENRNEKKQNDGRNRLIENLTLLFVVLTTIGVFFQAYILHSTDAAIHKTLIATDRPWLLVEKISPAGNFTFNETTGQLLVDIQLTNVGKAPALNVHILPKMFFLKTGRSISGIRDAACDELKARKVHGQVIFSQQGKRPQAHVLATVTQEDRDVVADAIKGDGFPFVSAIIVGCVSYDYAVGDSHHETAFVQMVTPLLDPKVRETAVGVIEYSIGADRVN